MPSAESVSASGIVPVFPLPSVVFFPHTVLPLHVFEHRYRALVRDAVAGEGLIAMALLRPGWERTYHGSPAFHEIGTVGRIEDLEWLPDGRFNLKLVGLQRARLGEVLQQRPYRRVRMVPLLEERVDDQSAEVIDAKLELLASHGCLLRELTENDQPLVFDERVPFEHAVNGACAGLPVEAELRQQLLEESDLMVRQRRSLEVLDGVLTRLLQMKQDHSDDGRSIQ